MMKKEGAKDHLLVVFRTIYLVGILQFFVSMFLPWYQIEIVQYKGDSQSSFFYRLMPFDGWIRIAERSRDIYNVPDWSSLLFLFIAVSIISAIIFTDFFINIFNYEKSPEKRMKKEIHQNFCYLGFFIPILVLIYLFNNQLPFPTGSIENVIEGTDEMIKSNNLYSIEGGLMLSILSPIFMKIGIEGVLYSDGIKEHQEKMKNIQKLAENERIKLISSMTSLDKLIYLRKMEESLKNEEDFNQIIKEMIEI
jgi:hypothetical protein